MSKVIAFDTETHLFGPYEMAPKVVCLSWAELKAGPASLRSIRPQLVVGDDEIERWLHQHLDAARRGEEVLVGHYVAYDMSCILRSFPSVWDSVWEAYEADGVTDTGIRERLIDIAMGEFKYYYNGEGKKIKTEYRLAELAKRWLQTDLDKSDDGWRKRYGELDAVALKDWPAEAKKYATDDAKATLMVYANQERRAKTMGYTIPTQFEDARADFALRLTSVWGIEPDAERVESLWNKTIDEMEDLVPSLVDAGLARGKKVKSADLFGGAERRGPPEITKSLKAIRQAIVEHWPSDRFGEVPKTEKGSVQTGEDVIQRCLNYEPLRDLVRYSEFQKLASTYISKLFAPIIHARFYAVGGKSNRTSCDGPNLQNQVEATRRCFRAREGSVFLSCDFDSQEMRTLAQSCLDICGKSSLAERYRQDRHFDPHLEFAAALAETSVETAKRELAAGNHRMKPLRQQAKVANFGFPGGMSHVTLVHYGRGWGLMDLTEARTKELKDQWFYHMPEMRDYFNHAQSLIGDAGSGTLVIPRSGFRRAGCGYNDTSNGYFQTLAAHASKDALFRVCRRAYATPGSALYGSRPVLFVHDDIILEVPEEAGHEAGREIEEVMVEAMEKWTPDVPAAASATLMKYWSKKAEKVFDKNGRLIPWEER